MSLNLVSSNKAFGGWHHQYTHTSAVLKCEMRFAVYLPPQVEQGEKVPVLYWLSGLTCTDENFMQKAGGQRIAAELGMAIVAPDTSPRGEGVANDEAYDLGQGAGFYVNATQPPWAEHYRMYDYIVEELPALIEAAFPVTERKAIAGHSMGGHGALMIGLRNPHSYTSISAFSPIVNPCEVPWGQKAFAAYLGEDKTAWQAYDTCRVLSQNAGMPAPPVRVDQGLNDAFLPEQLQPEALEQAAAAAGVPVELHRHEGYDHSYYFIASFIEDQLRFHKQYL